MTSVSDKIKESIEVLEKTNLNVVTDILALAALHYLLGQYTKPAEEVAEADFSELTKEAEASVDSLKQTRGKK